MGIHTHRHTCPTIILLLLVSLAVGTCLKNRCLAVLGDKHRDRELWEGLMKHVTEMRSGAMIDVTSLINTDSLNQTFMQGSDSQTETVWI
jgi:hypothetical protein